MLPQSTIGLNLKNLKTTLFHNTFIGKKGTKLTIKITLALKNDRNINSLNGWYAHTEIGNVIDQ